MRKIFTLLLVSFTTSISFAQFFSENWDTPLLWRTRDLDADVSPATVWVPGDFSTFPAPLPTFGNAVASASGPGRNPDELLISPEISIANLDGNMKLVFDVLATTGVTTAENYSVYIVLDTTAIAATINTIVPPSQFFGMTESIGAANANQILTREIDLTSFIGEDHIYLIFRHHNSANQSSIVVDNISLYNANISANSNSGCIGSTFIFTDASVGTYNSYIWDFGPDATPSTASGAGPHNVTFANLGVKNVSLFPIGTNNLDGDTNVLDITIVNTPAPSFSADATVGCNPTSIQFTNTNPGTNCIYTFSDGFTANTCTVTRTFTTAGTFDVTLTEALDATCFGTTTQTGMITINASPDAEFLISQNPVDMIFPYVSFVNRSSATAIAFNWTFGDNSIGSSAAAPTHTYPENIAQDYNVTLRAIAANGCVDSTTQVLTVSESVLLYIPNSFTPNGDELNNRFEPSIFSGIDPQNYNLKIFNRWGQIIFESNDPEIGWDGDYGAGKGMAETGLYTYKLEFGTSSKDERRLIVGHVNLLR